MHKRDVRLRREYLYRKSLEAKEHALAENKKKLKAAIAAGKSIPTELRSDEKRLRHELELEDANTAIVATHEDDEYARAGEADPKVVVTTSHDPSSRLKMFLKEIRLLIPNSERVNRGSYTTKELIQACKKNEVTDIIIVHEHRGDPDGLIVCHLPHGPTAYFGLSNVVMRHDIQTTETVPEAYPHLIFDNMHAARPPPIPCMLSFCPIV
jgi:U3 small nucleolar ribonucleoprotein protein IMP4